MACVSVIGVFETCVREMPEPDRLPGCKRRDIAAGVRLILSDYLSSRSIEREGWAVDKM
jgi:hypothetical protein